MPSCSRMRRQLLHFQVVCKTWSIFQELTSIFSFRKRRLKQLKFSENRNKSVTKAKICSEKHNHCVEIFLLLPDVAVVIFIFLKPPCPMCGKTIIHLRDINRASKILDSTWYFVVFEQSSQAKIKLPCHSRVPADPRNHYN